MKSNTVDNFQQKHLYGILDIKWPKFISNEDLYETTAGSIWSDKITNRRLTFLGHIVRLPEETQVHKFLNKFNIPRKKPRGVQKQTWIRSASRVLRSRG